MSAVRVLVSGAAGNIGYAILPMICNGNVFGFDQPIDLVLLDIEPCMGKLEGVKMEIDDSAYPLVKSVTKSCVAMEAFKGVQYAFLIGGFPRLKGMLRKDLIAKNTAIFSETGKAIDAVADKNIKVLVVANPANTNARVLMEHAPSIPRENFSAMTRLDANRAKSLLRETASKKLGHDVPLTEVKNIIIWGNHSDTQFPDVNFATVEGKPAREVVGDDAYLDGEFLSTVQLRGKAVIAARGLSSACSAAKAACDHMHDWVQGTAEGEYSIMSVCSDGKHYDVPEGLIFSFPVTVKDGKWSIVEGLELDARSKEFFAKTIAELQEEKEAADEFLAGQQ